MKKKEPSFEEAISASSLWCTAWESGELSDEVLADRVSELLETINGARGFFVFSLSSDSPLMDRLPDALVFVLRNTGKMVVDLTAKNLVMSTAMAYQHQQDKKTIQQVGSERIKRRCIDLLRLLEPYLVKDRLESLLLATEDSGKDVKFFSTWNYDNEQKKEIAMVINSIAEN
ncbi:MULTISPECIES: hypothetical protein [unclassified Prochlorococcus]|uniref:hypothetical protein n=1 Tax=unclassified Prochlorococcus TaxID=2627481 RepID=UPI000533740A|nr:MULTISPECIES: hypothetical protein [unclassified Prochlorococcus]KGG16286.1 hypothetical protein EV07_1455 [Prochlorococcus sp. MIT 0603]KGG17980.1 hypothetical protein EV06_0104 [Prochlorococcus sp. MIT 0602]